MHLPIGLSAASPCRIFAARCGECAGLSTRAGTGTGGNVASERKITDGHLVPHFAPIISFAEVVEEEHFVTDDIQGTSVSLVYTVLAREAKSQTAFLVRVWAHDRKARLSGT